MMMKRERERVICINTKERRENSFKVWRISQSVVVSSRRVLLKFFFRKNLLSQTTEKKKQHQYS